MALWSNTDANTSAPQFTVDITNGKTGVEAYNLTPVGTYGVDTAEAAVTPVTHAGWILRTEGSGGRAGRVQTETLIAMGSMTGDGTVSANDDVIFPDS